MNNAPRGEKSSLSFLTEEQVRKIKAKHKGRYVDNRFTDIIAREYGVNEATIRKIRSNKTWRHVRAAQ